MNITFVPRNFQQPWTLQDDCISVGKRGQQIIPINSITKVKISAPEAGDKLGLIHIYYDVGLQSVYIPLYYPVAQAEEGLKAGQYLSENVKTQPEDYRKRCNVCGHIFCYTKKDLAKNEQLKKDAEWESGMSVAKSLFVSSVAGGQSQQSAYDLESRIIDYSKCPKCGSADLRDATEEDIARANAPQGQVVQQVSAADELKKYKELLDMGVITQEEFDAKKKQLLGL